ncbi:unnamed protein product [Peniophora sp. CBMAI 1063]|nr:unnamed protein product [Peniophora sp. CBMAI 1063]
MLEQNPPQDRLEALELQLCDAQIVVERAAANNEPLPVQELASLQVERVELEMKQETARASGQLRQVPVILVVFVIFQTSDWCDSQSDLALQDLELALLSRRIDCATLAINGANEAQRRLGDLQLKRAALLFSQHKKHLQRPAPSTAPPSASTPATTSSSDPMTRPALSSSRDWAPAPDASFDSPSGLSPPTPLCLSPSLPASPLRDSSPRTSSLGGLSTPGVLADKTVVPDSGPSLAVDVDDHEEDAHDTGDVERELIGEYTCQPASVASDAPTPRKESTAIIDIDDAGVAHDLTPPHGQSNSKSPDALPLGDRELGDDTTSPEDEDAPFLFVGSPHAPRTVLEARANKSGMPPKTSPEACANKSSSPLKDLIKARANKSASPLKASPKADAKPGKSVASTRKSGACKEPTAFPQRWMFRVLNFGAAALRTSSDWPESICREVAVLWAAVVSWETRNDFKVSSPCAFVSMYSLDDRQDGTAKAPAQSPLMGAIVSKSRFGPNFQDVIKKEPDFSTRVARCIDGLRHTLLADVVKMHGTHGIAAVARALLEAYNSDESFGGFFSPLARELATILDIATEVSPIHTDDDDDAQAVGLTGTVIEALNARDGYEAAPATRAIHALLALAGNEKKRDASHLDAEAGPSKRARRSPDE